MKKFYITTPIYYVNDKPHLGTAYTTILADTLARYYRWQGKDVFFLTGTDEHGLKIQQRAQNLNKNPQDFCDEISKDFQYAWKALNISYDKFIRTTDLEHKKAVQDGLVRLYKKGLIYKGEYKGLYCVGCEQYKTKSELIEGKCPYHNREPELKKEKTWLFKLSYFKDKILNLIQKNYFRIEPETRRNEIISFLKREGLEDLSISRPKEKVWWGIELPFDKSETTYVWIDAFFNYLTGLGWPKNKNQFQHYWPPDIQLMSKDILRVHATIWPSLLLGLEEKLPRRICVHGFLSIDGQKMSKSLGNVVDPVEIVKKYGADALRFFLLKNISFGKDGDFTIEKLEKCYNADLANDLGNLVQRVAVMINKYLKGKIPNCKVKNINQITLKDIKGIKILNSKEIKKIDQLINSGNFEQALSLIWEKVRATNQSIEISKPWVLFKKNPKQLEKVLYNLVVNILVIACFLSPFIPQTSKTIIEIYQGPKVKFKNSLFPKIK